ncbi:BTB/POZ domain-containing protein [Colletotrichum camelliae]|nr:BTB/POZ domain-containing protein [Colletotrichum camelliae]
MEAPSDKLGCDGPPASHDQIAAYPALSRIPEDKLSAVKQLIELLLKDDGRGPTKELAHEFVDLCLWALNNTMEGELLASESRIYAVSSDTRSWLQRVQQVRSINDNRAAVLGQRPGRLPGQYTKTLDSQETWALTLVVKLVMQIHTTPVQSSPQEAADGAISLPDDEPLVIDMMIQYFYLLDYQQSLYSDSTSQSPELEDTNSTHISCLLLHAKTTAIQDWDPAAFLDAASEAYTSTLDTDRGLRDAVIEVFAAHKDLLYEDEAKVVVERLGPLGYDFLVYLHRRGNPPLYKSYRSLK